MNNTLYLLKLHILLTQTHEEALALICELLNSQEKQVVLIRNYLSV